MSVPLPYSVKRFMRLCDCRLTQRKEALSFRGESYNFYRTYWWNAASQQTFDQEIVPYFETLGDFQPSTILDVGSAEGHFGITAAKAFPRCQVYAFEPALRQRVLLTRNARLNGVKNLAVEPFGLWDSEDSLPFRTNGAESSFAPVSRFKGKLKFPEIVRVVSLDHWVKTKALEKIDLIKMDAEGAELEILEGAREVLNQFHPRLLIQAYHLRDGSRTFERCAETLSEFGYDIAERPPASGLLYASTNPSAANRR